MKTGKSKHNELNIGYNIKFERGNLVAIFTLIDVAYIDCVIYYFK